VQYTGTPPDGDEVRQPLDSGTPFEFVIGQGQVIRGVETTESSAMKKGGKQDGPQDPAALAYGHGVPAEIGPEATLLFDIEMLEIFPPGRMNPAARQ